MFTNMLLADEINRTPPKTQAALLQAMQEHQVTAGRQTYQLPDPFFVLATQNPIEQEGTYPLPEAQLDRFMFELRVGYPSRAEEEAIVEQTTGGAQAAVHPVLDAEAVLAMQELVRRVPVSRGLISKAVGLARRPGRTTRVAQHVKEFVEWGAGPACIAVPGAGRQGAGRHGRAAHGRPGRRAAVPPRSCGIAWSRTSPPRRPTGPARTWCGRWWAARPGSRAEG